MSGYGIQLDKEKKDVTVFFNSSIIKLIVFDLHGTLTNRTSVHPYHIDYRNKYIEHKLGRTLPKHFSGGTDEAFALFPELDKYDFYRYRDNDPLFDFEKIHKRNPTLVEKLKLINKQFITVLYTDSHLKQIERTLQAIGIEHIFDRIIGMENGHRKEASQKTTYPSLCSFYNVKMEEVLIVGDRMDKDINPVLRSGGNGIRIESCAMILKALDMINTQFGGKK